MTQLSKELFHLPLDLEWLVYAGITQVYKEGILTTMFAQGQIQEEKGLWNSFHVWLSNEKNLNESTFEQIFYALVEKSLQEVLQKSLPSG